MAHLTLLQSAGPTARGSLFVSAAGLLSLIALGPGCVTTPKYSVAEEASMQEKARCVSGVSEAAIAPVFEKDSVERIEPLYTAASPGGHGSGGNYSQLIGAIIHLRAINGVTAEWLDGALECHSARRLLGELPEATPTDPFWLPGRMVDIEAVAARAGYHVYVRGGNIHDAEAILARANAFLEASARR